MIWKSRKLVKVFLFFGNVFLVLLIFDKLGIFSFRQNDLQLVSQRWEHCNKDIVKYISVADDLITKLFFAKKESQIIKIQTSKLKLNLYKNNLANKRGNIWLEKCNKYLMKQRKLEVLFIQKIKDAKKDALSLLGMIAELKENTVSYKAKIRGFHHVIKSVQQICHENEVRVPIQNSSNYDKERFVKDL